MNLPKARRTRWPVPPVRPPAREGLDAGRHAKLRFMQMVFEKAGRRKDLFWDMLERIRQFLERRRVVREGSW